MAQTPPIYTAHDISDLINTLPTLFGFRPAESLVAIATRGPRRRFGFRLRIDIPTPEHVDDLARLVVSHLRHQGAEGAIAIAVTEQQEIARDLLAAIEMQLDEIEPIVLARADGSHYWSDEPGFPAEGIAYETSDHHLSIVHAVAAGQEILPDRAALVARFRAVEEPRRTWLVHATESVLERVVPVVADVPAGGLAEVGMREIRPIIDRSLAGERLDDGALVSFFVWVSSIRVRDAVWDLVDRANATRMLALLTQVSRAAVPPFEPAVLSLAAFAAWLTGDGAQSLIAAERALEADPDYSMAQLMLDMVQGGVDPVHWDGMTGHQLSDTA